MATREAKPPPPDLDALVEKRRAELFQSRLSEFDWEALARLALVPLWTKSLALSCIPELERFLPAAQDAGLSESIQRSPGATESLIPESFGMPVEIRERVISYLRERQGGEALREVVGKLGSEILDALPEGGASSVVRWWARLASQAAYGEQQAARWLENQIDQLIAQDSTGEALALVRAGEALATALGGELPAALRLGSGRLARAYRAVPDIHFLRHFLVRQEQLAAFYELLADPGPQWALHYLGVGGVGKTMLLRHISAQLSEQLGLAVSRIDFDHISPDYPARRPAQLLVELADQLRPYLSTSREEAVLSDVAPESAHLEELALSGQFSFTELFHQAEEMQEQSLQDAVPPDVLLSSPLGKVLRAFTDLLKLIEKQGRRAVLILDTCEELSKIREDGTTPPSVAATFSMLGAVHQVVPSVRVIFAGRRLLAHSGYGWEVKDADAPDAPTAQLMNREHLRLHVLRGFDREEALRYLGARYEADRQNLSLTPQMLEAVLGRCREASLPPRIIWSEGQKAKDTPRYNPFDLDLYAQLLLEEERLPPGERKLTPEVIASGKSDPYVEARIIRRIEREDVRRLLPAVVLLRRFDEEMFRPALDTAGPSAQEAFLELGRQEWLHSSRDAALNTRFFEVDRNLQPRLDRYFFQDAERATVEGARSVLAPHLADLVRQLPLRRLSVSHVEAALRLLPPDEAATLWEQIAARPVVEADWNWMRRVSGRLLGEGGVAGPPEEGAPVSETARARYDALRASIRAAHTASLLHQGDTADHVLITAWQDVEQHAAAHPDAGAQEWLSLRASAGELAAALRAGQGPTEEHAATLENLLIQTAKGDGPAVRGWDEAARREQVAASLTAALEAFVERAETDGVQVILPDRHLIITWVDAVIERSISAELASFILVLAARALSLNTGWEGAPQQRLRQALMLLEGAQQGGSRGAWADWAAPASMVDRVRLEALLRIPRPLPAEGAASRPAWLEESRKRLHQIDGERLTSLLLQRSLNERPLDRDVLAPLEEEERYRPGRQPVCQAHRAVPPLLVTLALGRLALGDADAALELLNKRVQEARRNPRDTTTTREAEMAKLRVIRRMRMPGHGQALVERSGQRDPEEQAAAWAVRALRGHYVEKTALRDAPSYSASMVHAWLSTEEGLRHAGAADILGVLEPFIGRADVKDDFERISLELDWQEAILLARRFSIPDERLPSRPFDAAPFDPDAWLRVHPNRVEDASRLYLRSVALFELPPALEPWRDRLGGRRFAEIALEEGELLALRLPERAARLLEAACFHFIEARDRAGFFISSVRWAIALVHGGIAEGARYTLLKQVHPAYMFLQTNAKGPPVVTLPAWDDLLAWSRSPAKSVPLERLDHPAWAGWLHRLFCCLLWDAGGEGTRQQRLEDALKEAYGSPLPAELDLDRAKEEAVIANADARRADVLRLEIYVPDRKFIAQPPTPDMVVPVDLNLIHSDEIIRARAMSPGLRKPREAARDLPPKLIAFLTYLKESETRLEQGIALQVASEVASAPWEAVFHFALPPGEPLKWYRSGPPLNRSRSSELTEVEVFCGAAWNRMVTRGWAPLGVRSSVSSDLNEYLHRVNIPPANRRNPLRAYQKVLHLIGRPLRTGRGLSLQVQTGASGVDVAQTGSEYSPRGEAVLSPDDLPVNHAALVVLQGEPAQTYGGLSSEHEQTADLRALANELFYAGAPAVIMLPTLPLELAQHTLERLAFGLAGPSPLELSRLLDAVAAVRHMIATPYGLETFGAEDELLVEASLGVTLFTPEAE
jgi:hypothetical protein